MKFLDKVALNRLINILTIFILLIIKIFANKEIDQPKPKKKKILPWRNKNV